MVHIFSSIPNSIGFTSEYLTMPTICIEQKIAIEKTTRDQKNLSQFFLLRSASRWGPWMPLLKVMSIKYSKIRWPTPWLTTVDVDMDCITWTFARRRSESFSKRSFEKWKTTSMVEITDMPANNPMSPPSAPRKSEKPKASVSMNE